MNPFDYIQEMKNTLHQQMDSENINKPGLTIPLNTHLNEMLNMLSILEAELKNAEYNYVVESVDGEITTFDELAVFKKQLSEDVLIFQPALTSEEMSMVDMQSLADTLRHLHNNGLVQERILLLPPGINVFKAKLVDADKEL